METDCCRRFIEPGGDPEPCRLHRKAAQQSILLSALILLPLLFTSCKSHAQSATSAQPELVRGSIIGAQGKPVGDATVEVRNLQGIEIGKAFTNAAGKFVIRAATLPGDYIVRAAKGSLINHKRITLAQREVEINMALPPAAENTARQNGQYTVSVAALGVPEKARTHLQSAQKEFTQGHLAVAAKEIVRTLVLDPEFSQAFSTRALISLAMRDFRAAAEDAARATALDPWDKTAYVILGTAYNSLNRYEDATAAEQKALSLDPDCWQARLEAAKSLYGQEQFVLALRELEMVQVDFPDVHLVRGNILMRLNRKREASAEFSLFLAQAPEDLRSDRLKEIIATVRATAQ